MIPKSPPSYFTDPRYSILFNHARSAYEELASKDRVIIVSHIDADGLSSSAIAKFTLDRAGIENKIVFIRNIDDNTLSSLPEGFKWFVDLGSGSMKILRKHNIKCIVCDHHVPDQFDIPAEARHDILNFLEESDFPGIIQVNPHFAGLNGSYEISGAGTVFLVSLWFSEKNRDFAKNAIVGAIGDVQNSNSGKLQGLNRIFIKMGEEDGKIRVLKDIKLFGRTQRPIKRFISIPGDINIPGVSNYSYGASKLLRSLNIEAKKGDKFVTYNDLKPDEKKNLITAIAERIIISGSDDIFSLIGETYIFPDESPNLPTWDSAEFATLLNACGRYDEGMTGVMVAGGDRSIFLEKAMDLMKNHRKKLQEGYAHIMDKGLKKMKNFDYFYAGKDINENIVGIIANMILANEGDHDGRPLITMADSEDNTLKVSVRAEKSFLSRGMDLADILRKSAEKCGGVGGGHDLAAGANIPLGMMKEFLEYLDENLSQ